MSFPVERHLIDISCSINGYKEIEIHVASAHSESMNGADYSKVLDFQVNFYFIVYCDEHNNFLFEQ